MIRLPQDNIRSLENNEGFMYIWLLQDNMVTEREMKEKNFKDWKK